MDNITCIKDKDVKTINKNKIKGMNGDVLAEYVLSYLDYENILNIMNLDHFSRKIIEYLQISQLFVNHSTLRFCILQ